MKNCFRKLNIFTILLFVISTGIFAQNYNIDYFGIVVTDIDSNMAKMTSDLYLNQLNEISNYSTVDKRTENSLSKIPSQDLFSNTNLSFFTEIIKNTDSDKWTVIFHVVDAGNHREEKESKIYDSFYKILMEPKSTLQVSLKNLIEKNHSSAIETTIPQSKNSSTMISTETLSGTWAGENFIDKIVILRGGRGFVIFNNGASMNIGVELENTNKGQQVVITQKGRANASYFPDLPRNVALNAALTAEPIVWKLSVINSDLLKGSKTTLVADADSYNVQDIQVTWKRVN